MNKEQIPKEFDERNLPNISKSNLVDMILELRKKLKTTQNYLRSYQKTNANLLSSSYELEEEIRDLKVDTFGSFEDNNEFINISFNEPMAKEFNFNKDI